MSKNQKKLVGFTEEEFRELANPVNQELIEDFLGQQHLSDKTLEQYRSALYIFAKWVYDNLRNKEIPSLKPRDALRFQNFMIEAGLSSSAIKFKRSAVSSLCGFIELYYSDEYPMFRNIYTKAIPNVAKSTVKENIPLTKAEREKIIKTLTKKEDWQRLAFFHVAYSSAGRRAEIVQLKKEVINYKEYSNKEGVSQGFYLSHPIRGKGRGKEGKSIRLMIGAEAMEAIKKWIEVRGEDDCEYVFVSNSKNGYRNISINTTNLWVDVFGDIIGRKINPHLIRKSRSTDIVVEEGKDIKFAQILLNHESSETTDKHYVIRDENEDLGELFS